MTEASYRGPRIGDPVAVEVGGRVVELLGIAGVPGVIIELDAVVSPVTNGRPDGATPARIWTSLDGGDVVLLRDPAATP